MSTTVNAVERTFRILDLFKNGQSEYGVSEIGRALGLHKSTVHGIVQTLCKFDILDQNTATRKYRLGPGLVALGDLARQRLDLRELAHPFLVSLAEDTGATVLLGIFENDGITIVDIAESPNELRVSASVGQRVPFCAGSFGRAFLAFMDADKADRLLRGKELPRFTATSITDPDVYKASLSGVREQGYAVDDNEEYLDGVWAASAPIFDGGEVAAAVTVVGFTARITQQGSGRIVQATVRAARQITQRLTGMMPGSDG